MLKCPKCNSTDINQYRKPTGKIWCSNPECGFSVPNKEIDNPFINECEGCKEYREFMILYKECDNNNELIELRKFMSFLAKSNRYKICDHCIHECTIDNKLCKKESSFKWNRKSFDEIS